MGLKVLKMTEKKHNKDSYETNIDYFELCSRQRSITPEYVCSHLTNRLHFPRFTLVDLAGSQPISVREISQLL